jgi:hypothetical protein
MTLILEVPPEREAVFEAQAQACGLTVQEWLLRLADRSGAGFASRSSGATDPRPIGEIILDNMKDVPREEFARLPKDGASQHDHYLYGHPKHPQ